MGKLKKAATIGGVLVGCFALAFVAGSFLLVPGESDATMSDADVDISVQSVIQMSTSTSSGGTDSLSKEVTPTSSGNQVSGDITANVNTNNATGYTLSMNAKTASNVDLVGVNGTDKILNSGNTTAGVLANNTWGYNVNSGTTPTTFLRIPGPLSPDSIAVTSAPGAGANKVTVATKVNTSVPAGVYNSLLTFTAVGNYVPTPVISMQEITAGTCPRSRTLAYDARDNRTYWVQTLEDGRCWMLTNLAYGGGGDNTYGDAKTISNGESVASSYTDPYYYVPTGANPTDSPDSPSTSTDGGATDPQYGYLYNWCAAMGVQTGTSACANAITPAPDASISICPSGWRLPTGNAGGEFQLLNDAVNGGSTSNPSGLLSEQLMMYSGGWNNGFSYQGISGSYRSSTQFDNDGAYDLDSNSGAVAPDANYINKRNGLAVRCILDIPAMQEMTIEECTDKRVMAYDVRDNRTYWVQRTADGKCWMETNLAYAGGGTNTYGDVKTITNSETEDATQPYYMISPNANPTDYPVTPSTSTDGGTTNPQYGYLYNWCAAMGVQATAACAQTTTPEPDVHISICPSGWRLPTGGPGSEFVALNNAVNGGTTSSNSGLMSNWLAMFNGYWRASEGFNAQGNNGYYWSSTQSDGWLSYNMLHTSSLVRLGGDGFKRVGYAVRCVMDDTETGDNIQTVTIKNCPSVRTRVRDARDDATYWVQKMTDGECWMLTNLAYGGGGDNTYGDVKTITDGSGASASFTTPYYYVPTGANRTSGTTDPSTSTSGTGQYGYLYNWCAAMGVQTSTSACASADTPLPNTSVSVCPSGWRLPTGDGGGEYQIMAASIGVTNSAAGSALLRSSWLASYGGDWNSGGFNSQGGYGSYWSSTMYDTYASYFIYFNSSSAYPSTYSGKTYGYAVRCIAN